MGCGRWVDYPFTRRAGSRSTPLQITDRYPPTPASPNHPGLPAVALHTGDPLQARGPGPVSSLRAVPVTGESLLLRAFAVSNAGLAVPG
eukprot:764187-Hanusia_phi.AAC.2